MAEDERICRLVVQRDGVVLSVHDMTRPVMTVGRGRECELRLEGTTVSRRHISIEARNGAVVVRDLGSRNGTYFQGRLIREVGPARAMVITYINPAVAIALGVTLLGEPLTVGMAGGFPLVIVGSILATGRGPSAKLSEVPDSQTG